MYWKKRLKQDSLDKDQSISEKQLHPLFFPRYYTSIEEHKLPTATLWSNLILGNLNRFSDSYNINIKRSKSKDIFVENLTSAQIENYFGNIKRNQSTKQPIPYFIERNFKDLKWQQRNFFERILEGLKGLKEDDCTKDNSINKEEIIKQTDIIEGSWNKKPPKNSSCNKLGYYSLLRHKPLKFAEENNKNISQNISSGFSSKHKVNKTLKNNRENSVKDGKADKPETCSSCKMQRQEKRYNEWVCCDICNSWFHCFCVKITSSFASSVRYYHCPPCVEDKFVPFLKYLSYHAFEGINMEKQEEVKEWFLMWRD